MIVTHLKGQPISDQSVKHVFFWMPDGTSHDCDQFNCPDVARYLHCLVNRVPASLAVSHTSLRAHLTASLA
jgi:hypothetical protein